MLLTLDESIRYGGMQLSPATITTYVKYPYVSDKKNSKKTGIFHSEKEEYEKAAAWCGIDKINSYECWEINPLNKLLEAADDLCNYLSDFEDMFNLNIIDFDDAERLLKSLSQGDYDATRYTNKDPMGKISYLVAISIGKVCEEIFEYLDNHIENFSYVSNNFDLVKVIPSHKNLKPIIELRQDRVINSKKMARMECLGYEIITHFLDKFVPAVVDQDMKEKDDFCQHYLRIIDDAPKNEQDIYRRLLRVTDFISGMTDSFALRLYQELTGVRIPADYV